MVFKPKMAAKLAAQFSAEVVRKAERSLVSSCTVEERAGRYRVTLSVNAGADTIYNLTRAESAGYKDIADIVDDFSGEMTRELDIARPRTTKEKR